MTGVLEAGWLAILDCWGDPGFEDDAHMDWWVGDWWIGGLKNRTPTRSTLGEVGGLIPRILKFSPSGSTWDKICRLSLPA